MPGRNPSHKGGKLRLTNKAPKRTPPKRRPWSKNKPQACARCGVMYDRPNRWKEDPRAADYGGYWLYPELEVFQVDLDGTPTTYICIECGLLMLPDGRKAYPGGYIE